MPKYSIVIGTYNHLDDCLRPCVDSILKYTTLNDFSTELIIVANGCTDGTREYVEGLQRSFHNIRLLWYDEPLGFTKAYNIGLKEAKGDYIVLFNNDNILLDQPYMKWLELMVEPFERDSTVGITGPMKEHCPHADRDFILFFCSMISRNTIEKVGYLDEIFSPGYGEDTDYSARIQNAGLKVIQVPDESRQFYDTNRRTGVFPLYHAGNKTFANWPDGDKLLAKNNKLLKDRYNKQNQKEDKLGKLLYNIEKAQACDGYMSDNELVWLASQAEKAMTIIEIGSWHGKSSRAIADNMPVGGTLYCVDHWAGSAVERDSNHMSARWNDGDHAFLEFCDNLADHIHLGRVIPIRMSSKNAAAWFKKQGVKADFIFIDAGHTYDEIKEDINLWESICPAGVFSGHDYNHMDGAWEGVTQAVNEHFTKINDAGERFVAVNNPKETNIWSRVLGYGGKYTTDFKVKTGKAVIYDCFPFFNELDILDIRFDELYDTVDRFVITEATLTHGGKPKPLFFQENLKRYEKYLNKVTHIVVDSYPAYDSWSIERHQRDQLMRGLTQCKDDDIIIIGDADEIPRGSVINQYDPSRGIMALVQKLYYYKLNCQATQDWDWCKMVTYGELKTKSPCQVRYTPFTKRDDLIYNAGWHFSYIADVKGIIGKIEASAHQEYNREEWKDPNKIERLVREGRDIFARPLEYAFVEVDSTYPKYVLNNLEQFRSKDLIANVFEVV